MDYLLIPLTVIALLELAGLVYYQRLAVRNRILSAYWRAVATARREKVSGK